MHSTGRAGTQIANAARVAHGLETRPVRYNITNSWLLPARDETFLDKHDLLDRRCERQRIFFVSLCDHF
jgi:hypothetical protein